MMTRTNLVSLQPCKRRMWRTGLLWMVGLGNTDVRGSGSCESRDYALMQLAMDLELHGRSNERMNEDHDGYGPF